MPAGTRHAFRNRGREVAHIRCHATPPLSLQEFLTDAAAMSRAGKLNRFGLPTSFQALKEVAAFAERHREMVVMSNPPAIRPEAPAAAAGAARVADSPT